MLRSQCRLPPLCSPDVAYLAVLADFHWSLPWNFVRNRLCACFRPTFDGGMQFLSCKRNFPSLVLPCVLYFSVFSVFIFPSHFLCDCSCSYSVSFFLLLLVVGYWISASRRKLYVKLFLLRVKLTQWRRRETLQQFIVPRRLLCMCLYWGRRVGRSSRHDESVRCAVTLSRLQYVRSMCTVCVVYVACRPVHDAPYRQSLTSAHIRPDDVCDCRAVDLYFI